MLIPTTAVSRLLDLPNRSGVRYAAQCLKAFGLKPTKVIRNGRLTNLWSVAQAAAVVVYYGLMRAGVGKPFRGALCAKIAATPDEQLEAKLADGRKYILKGVGSPVAVTELLTLESIQQYLDERKGNPTAPRVEVIDVGSAIVDLFQSVRAMNNTEQTNEGTHADA